MSKTIQAHVAYYKLTAEFGDEENGQVSFTLVAQVESKGRTLQSNVTNVNGISSTLAECAKISDERFEELLDDSTWTLTREQAEAIFAMIEEWRQDTAPRNLRWLINALDDDRAAGEWEFPSDVQDENDLNYSYPRFKLDAHGRVSCPHCGGIGFNDVGDGDLCCQHCLKYCTTLPEPAREPTPRQRFIAIIKVGVDIATARQHSGEPIADDADLTNYVTSELGWATDSFDEFQVDVVRA